METTPYIYTPLNLSAREIRLLNLMPAALPTAPLVCSISHAILPPAPLPSPVYEALSYTWGDPTPTTRLTVLDQQASNTKPPPSAHYLSLPANLSTALFALRSQDESSPPRTLWIDAICIHQPNLAERTHQVNQMRHIYSRAAAVIVWLGPPLPNDRTPIALAFIRELVDIASELPLLNVEAASAARAHVYSKARLDDWEALDALMERPWWTRAWVVQEVAVSGGSATVFCGSCDYRVEWELFLPALSVPRAFSEERRLFWEDTGRSMTQIMRYTLVSGFPTRVGERAEREDGGADTTIPDEEASESTKLLTLLEQTWRRDATDARDKVYALLGLAGDGPRGSDDTHPDGTPGLTPDYTLDVAQVYQACAREVILRSGNLEILKFADASAAVLSPSHIPLDLLPSWVPDWRSSSLPGRPRTVSSLSWLVRTFDIGPTRTDASDLPLYGHDVNASADAPSFIATVSPDLSRLTVKALFVDTVHAFTRVFTDDVWYEFVAEADQLAQDISISANDTSSTTTPAPAEPKSTPQPTTTTSITTASALARHGGLWWPDALPDSVDESRLFSNAASAGEYRRFFVSQDQRLQGLGPALMEVGDAVVVVSGSVVPFLLRKEVHGFGDDGTAGAGNHIDRSGTPERGQAWKVVGQAYVQGIMHGEASRVHGAQWQEIDLV